MSQLRSILFTVVSPFKPKRFDPEEGLFNGHQIGKKQGNLRKNRQDGRCQEH
jgi:hypothetical protein